MARGEVLARRLRDPATQRHRRRPGELVRNAQPDARLVLPPRLHRGHVQHAGRQLQAGRQAERPRTGQRPGRRGEWWPTGVRRARQRQPDHTGRRACADHQHVPVAADRRRLLRAMRRRRLRHDRHRPRVHPRHHQPHDRRAEGRAQLAPGHERKLVRPARDGVPRRARIRAIRDQRLHHRRIRDAGF